MWEMLFLSDKFSEKNVAFLLMVMKLDHDLSLVFYRENDGIFPALWGEG